MATRRIGPDRDDNDECKVLTSLDLFTLSYLTWPWNMSPSSPSVWDTGNISLLLKCLLMAAMLRLYCCVMADMSTNSNLNYTYKINMLIDSFANINLRIGIIHVSFIHFSSRRRILLIMMFARIFSNCLVIASMLSSSLYTTMTQQ